MGSMFSSRGKRQAVALPTIIDHDQVLIAIVQCIPAAKDVMVFLAALPASSRSRPLAALYQLLQDPRRHVLATVSKPLDALWPLLRLDRITSEATSLVRDAMPVFPCASAGDSRAARPSDLDAVEWLELWSTKLTHYKHEDYGFYDLLRLLNVLSQCHRLQVVDVSRAYAIVEAVTTPLHRVRSLTIDCSCAASVASVDLWLASGHAEHLDLMYRYPASHEADALLGPMFLKATGLSSLAVHVHDCLVLAPLLAVASSFKRLARLCISIPESDVASLLQFLQQLSKPQLRSFSLCCVQGDFTDIVEVLASFPQLEELTLSFGHLRGRSPATVLPPSLRRVKFYELAATKATWNVLVTGLSRAHALDELSWGCCDLPPSVATAIAESLPNWIHRGIRNISLDGSSLRNKGASAMATWLRRTKSQSGVRIHLRGVRLSPQNYVALGDALTTCRGVSIELPPRHSEVLRTEATMRRISYHVDRRTKRLVLESPVPHPQES